MINLMDTLLKQVKLDLQLTPYRVLATGPQHGFVEFVPASHTLTSILDKFDKPNPIRKFFEQHNPKPQVLAKVLETFVKSCAGYVASARGSMLGGAVHVPAACAPLTGPPSSIFCFFRFLVTA